MAALPHPRRRWLFPATLAAVGAISSWAYAHMPAPNLLGHARVYNSVTLAAPGMRQDWTMHLRLDPATKPPGARWILHEGKQVGEGYELRWLPEKLGLQVYRAPDELLLGTCRLERMPRTVDFIRRGAWFRVLADGAEALTCLDPMGLAEQIVIPDQSQAWGCWTATDNSMGEAEITLIDDRAAPATPDGGDTSFASREHRDLDAIARVRAALAIDPAKQPSTERLQRALGLAAKSLEALPVGSGIYQRLRHWLALVEIRIAVSHADFESAECANDAVEQLAMLCDAAPVPETTGMLMSLLPRLATLACWRPAFPAAPTDELDAVIADLTPEAAKRDGVALNGGALVIQAKESGGGAKPSLREGDVIVEVNGAKISGEYDLRRAIARPPSSAKFTLTVIRDGRPAAIDANLQHGVLAIRAMWTEVLGATATAAIRTTHPAISDDLQYQLRLLIHASGCLQSPIDKPTRPGGGPDQAPSRRGQPQPAPAEAPPWLATRWRAFAGGDPEVPRYPEMPGSRTDPVVLAIELLMEGAVLEPVAAVSMRHGIGLLLGDKEVAQALQEPELPRSRTVLSRAAHDAALVLDKAPAREAAIAQVLLALRGIGSKQAVVQTMVGGRVPLIDSDPLLFAAVSVLLRRNPDLKDDDHETNIPGTTPVLRIPPELGPFERLLSGRSSTTGEIWLHDPAVLPPAQALATALAMQEAKGAPKPDWGLLNQVRCFTLPLELLIPSERKGGEARAPTGDQIKPPQVP